MPDPLAIASLGTVIILKPAHWRWALSVLPALWCLTSGFTLYLLDAPGATATLLALALYLVAMVWPQRKRSG
ncbi:hypothetical protein QC823_14820 [Halomonas vilamensis]|uniref:Uncharacterized protein n=1 Tax=Vreelandella vilamensis TaxID=531309 RepID=A0ABU1H7H2_9GAMM|nr:hypothetical protein [Halomonas vilamensis]MDR5900244.1 hypothetical protein [Halomonas vilamensis]